MSWKWKILILYLGFMGLILTMVFKTMYMRVDLVRPDYYAEELRYQERIDQRSNSERLSAPLSVTFNGQQVVLTFPGEMKKAAIEGTVLFYRPSDSRLDYRVSVQTDSLGTQQITPPVQKGLYQVQVDWQVNGQSFYSESSIMIP